MIYDLLSALNADIGENKCGTVMVEVAFLICTMLTSNNNNNCILIKRYGIRATSTHLLWNKNIQRLLAPVNKENHVILIYNNSHAIISTE